MSCRPSVLLINTRCDILPCTEELVLEAIFVYFYYESSPFATGNPDAVVILFFILSTQMQGYIDLIGHITSKFDVSLTVHRR